MARTPLQRPKGVGFERLEHRRVLAVVAVSTDSDVVNGDASTIETLAANPGDDGISLREAIEAANNTAGPDEVRFDGSFFTTTDGVPDKRIYLTGEPLFVSGELEITGLGVDRTVIDGRHQSQLLVVGTAEADSRSRFETSSHPRPSRGRRRCSARRRDQHAVPRQPFADQEPD